MLPLRYQLCDKFINWFIFTCCLWHNPIISAKIKWQYDPAFGSQSCHFVESSCNRQPAFRVFLLMMLSWIPRLSLLVIYRPATCFGQSLICNLIKAELLVCRQTLHGTHGVSQQVQSRSQQPPLSTQVKIFFYPTLALSL